MILLKSTVLDAIQQLPEAFSLAELVDTIAATEDNQATFVMAKESQSTGWDILLGSLSLFSNDFMTSRNQPPQQSRPYLNF